MFKVAVLMSTFNGEKYIKEQIESILHQSNVDISLYIRDDGSHDNTVGIINRIMADNPNVYLEIGNNIGVGNSFMSLVYSAEVADYYAFADQDDVWLPQKIISAISLLESLTTPGLYFSNQTVVDKELNVIEGRYKEEPDYSYTSIMCKNLLSGCTMVWNNSLACLIRDKKRRPSQSMLECRIHDVWVAMVASVVGTILYDSDSYILYRQHENNVVGVKKSSLLLNWIKKTRNPKLRNGRSKLCRQIVDKFGDLIDSDLLERLTVYANYRCSLQYKIKLMQDQSLRKKSGESKAVFFVKVLFGLV